MWAPSAGAALRAVFTLGRSLTRAHASRGDRRRPPRRRGGTGRPDARSARSSRASGPRSTATTGCCAGSGHCSQQGKIGQVLPVAYDWRLSNRYNADAARHDRRARAASDGGQSGPNARRAAGVRVPLDGRARRPLVHRKARRRGRHPQAHHPRHPLPRRGQGRRTAGQRGPQGNRAAGGRPAPSSPAACPRCTSCCPTTPASTTPGRCSASTRPPCRS